MGSSCIISHHHGIASQWDELETPFVQPIVARGRALATRAVRFGALLGTHLNLDGVEVLVQVGAFINETGKAMPGIEQRVSNMGRSAKVMDTMAIVASDTERLAQYCPDLEN